MPGPPSWSRGFLPGARAAGAAGVGRDRHQGRPPLLDGPTRRRGRRSRHRRPGDGTGGRWGRRQGGFRQGGDGEAFAALGYPVTYVPNRGRPSPASANSTSEPSLNVGVFAESYWRKNVVTQLGAVALIPAATRARDERARGAPTGPTTRRARHAPVGPGSYVQGSVDLNLYVTLSECHPLTPLECYAAGVPCLISPTSACSTTTDLRDLTCGRTADNPGHCRRRASGTALDPRCCARSSSPLAFRSIEPGLRCSASPSRPTPTTSARHHARAGTGARRPRRRSAGLRSPGHGSGPTVAAGGEAGQRSV